jgi:hypothetical protein
MNSLISKGVVCGCVDGGVSALYRFPYSSRVVYRFIQVRMHLKMKLFRRIYVGYSAALMVLRGVISGQHLRALISWNVE